MKPRTVATLIVFAFAVGAVLVYGALNSSQTIPATATIASVNVGVYTDSACTTACTSIDWGTIPPSGSATRVVYVKNSGTVPLVLSMSTSAYNPPSMSGLSTINWDRESYSLGAGASVSATMTLSISAGVSGVNTFSFNIVFSGTG